MEMNWISMNDRQPEAEGKYLVCLEPEYIGDSPCVKREVAIAKWGSYEAPTDNSSKPFKGFRWEVFLEGVAYWMPLPELPPEVQQ